MTLDQLREKLAFLYDEDIRKDISIFATTPAIELHLFNIENQFLDELKAAFIDEINAVTNNPSDTFTLENYSSSTKQLDAIYLYDIPDQLKPEMQSLKDVKEMVNPDNFVIHLENSIDQVNGLYIVIKSNEHVISLYKHIFGVDKIYAQRNLFIVRSHDQFVKQTESMLRISSSFQMLCVDDEIIMTDIQKLERIMDLKEVLTNRAAEHIATIVNQRQLVKDSVQLERVSKEPTMAKKLIHALTDGKVFSQNISNAEIIAFARSKGAKLNMSFEGNQFDLKNKIEAKRFIKLIDDDYLTSELTREDYDANQKQEL
ncbi:MAG: DUF4868 domain-containing protein [Paludibacteraceae bacterium]|nr:DUF4868 domain-containing protein [Paludibacteraceae bacterium]